MDNVKEGNLRMSCTENISHNQSLPLPNTIKGLRALHCSIDTQLCRSNDFFNRVSFFGSSPSHRWSHVVRTRRGPVSRIR